MTEKINRGNIRPGSVGHNLEPGMNHDQQRKDAAGYSTDLDMLTGGILCDAMDGGGPEVGNPYDRDPMGEDREMITFDTGAGMPSAPIGGGMGHDGESDRNVVHTKQGGSMAESPQTYSRYNKRGSY